MPWLGSAMLQAFALLLRLVCAPIVSVEYGNSAARDWLQDIYRQRAAPAGTTIWTGFISGTARGFSVLDVGGANPRPCFSDGLFRPGDAIADVQNLSSSCFTAGDRDAITLFLVDLEEDWSTIDAHVALHGKFSYAVTLHTLEDLHSPRLFARKLAAVADAGVVVTPSKFAELYEFEWDLLAGQGHFAEVGPWESNRGWRGYYHHRWVFTVRDGLLRAVPKSPLVHGDPELGFLTNYAARSVWDELRVFWQGDLPLEITLTHGPVASIKTVRALLANDEHDLKLRQHAERAMRGISPMVFMHPTAGLFRGVEAWSADGTARCLGWERFSGRLSLTLCAANAHTWHLDDAGFLQDMNWPGRCIGGAARRAPAVMPCPYADIWVYVMWTESPWFLIKNRDVSDLCLGFTVQGDIGGRSCAPSAESDSYGNLLLRPANPVTMQVYIPTAKN